jgi:YbbR domain-containing protein
LIITGRQGGIVTVAAPIKFHNLPENLTLVKSVPEQVDVQVKVFSVLVSSPKFLDVAVDLDLARIKEGQNVIPITEDDIKLPPGVVMSVATPSSVKVVADRKVKKSLRVRVKTYGYPPAGKVLRGLHSDPSLVMVEGPASLLAHIDTLETEEINLAEIAKSAVIGLKLQSPSPQVRFLNQEPVKVRVVLTAE